MDIARSTRSACQDGGHRKHHPAAPAMECRRRHQNLAEPAMDSRICKHKTRQQRYPRSSRTGQLENYHDCITSSCTRTSKTLPY